MVTSGHRHRVRVVGDGGGGRSLWKAGVRAPPGPVTGVHPATPARSLGPIEGFGSTMRPLGSLRPPNAVMGLCDIVTNRTEGNWEVSGQGIECT